MKRFIPVLILALFLLGIRPIFAEDYPQPPEFLSTNEILPAEKPLPVYPKLARTKGWQGTVMLKVIVGEEGNPREIFVHQTSGFELLDQSAIQAVKNWKFRALHSGKLILPYSLLVPIQFVLK